MLRQNTSLTLMLTSLAVVFSLYSPNAFSGSTMKIEFLQKIGNDEDSYIVTAESDSVGACIDETWPKSVQTIPGYNNGQNMHIIASGRPFNFCGIISSSQLFKVVSKEHPERVALFWWIKLPGRYPSLEREYDPDHLLWVDNSDDGDGDTIKVWVSYDSKS